FVLATRALLLLRPRRNESSSMPDSTYFDREGVELYLEVSKLEGSLQQVLEVLPSALWIACGAESRVRVS
ncbi:hypothetical protein ABZ723_33370, partial [Streptomyces sp. NPDC006700]|uniref:hypothetical protein n=1 Tax=Streptomyces sp. NPDC006700 TaxID=3154479 RepID=UPI0033C24F68